MSTRAPVLRSEPVGTSLARSRRRWPWAGLGVVIALVLSFGAGFLARGPGATLTRPPELHVAATCNAQPNPGNTSPEMRLTISWRSGTEAEGVRAIGVSAPTRWGGPLPPWTPQDVLNRLGPVEGLAGDSAERWAASALRARGVTGWEEEESSALDWSFAGTFVLSPIDRRLTEGEWTFGLVDRLSDALEPGTRIPLEIAFFDVDGSSTTHSLAATCT